MKTRKTEILTAPNGPAEVHSPPLTEKQVNTVVYEARCTGLRSIWNAIPGKGLRCSKSQTDAGKKHKNTEYKSYNQIIIIIIILVVLPPLPQACAI